jgi:Mn-dependent DtxR family transcriptional regulator
MVGYGDVSMTSLLVVLCIFLAEISLSEAERHMIAKALGCSRNTVDKCLAKLFRDF